MKTLVILCLCLAAVTADNLCANGESYWCSSLEAATKCGAYRHCLTAVWPNNQLEKDSSDICLYCTNIITDVKNYITNKQTQDQIRQFLEGACSIIPVQDMSTECRQVVDTYLTEILDLVTSEVDPQVICGLLKLCKGLEDKVYHPETSQPQTKHSVARLQVPAVNAAAICTDCQKFMNDIKAKITSPEGEKELEQLLEDNLCPALGSLASECKALIAAYVPEIMELLSGEFDPAQICQAMGFCNATSKDAALLLVKLRLRKSALRQAANKVSASPYCTLCKSVAAELQTMVKQKATQDEIEQFIKSEICAHLGALKGACDEDVDNYGPEFFLMLTLGMDPATFCSEIGLCSAALPQMSNELPYLPIMLRGALVPPPAPKVYAPSTQCVLCEFVMKQVDGMLANNATENEIVAALDKVCSIMPSTISKECLDFVNTYGPGILTLLEEELSPDLVCKSLGLCAQKVAVVTPLKGSPEECGVCETIIQYVDSLLTEKAVIDDMDKLFEKICNFLPDKMKSQCDTIIDSYGPVLIKLVTQYMDPRELCTEVGLCSNTTKPAVHEDEIVPVHATLVGTNECTYGPSFWCASRENAKKCRAEAHCEKHVWRQ